MTKSVEEECSSLRRIANFHSTESDPPASVDDFCYIAYYINPWDKALNKPGDIADLSSPPERLNWYKAQKYLDDQKCQVWKATYVGSAGTFSHMYRLVEIVT